MAAELTKLSQQGGLGGVPLHTTTAAYPSHAGGVGPPSAPYNNQWQQQQQWNPQAQWGAYPTAPPPSSTAQYIAPPPGLPYAGGDHDSNMMRTVLQEAYSNANSNPNQAPVVIYFGNNNGNKTNNNH